MTPRVLVADPDATARQILQMVLTSMGVVVDFADSDEAAFRRYLEVGHDLVVVDVLLPRQGGLALLQRLRSLRRGRDVPVLVVGAITHDKEFRKRALGELAALDYLKKPFVLEPVRAKLVQALKRCEEPPEAESDVVNPFAVRELPERGVLGSVLPSLLLHQLAAHRVTGCLTLSHRRQKKVLFFRDGEIHFALSNQLRETLSSHLLAQGKIDDHTVRTAVERMHRDGMKLGEFLIINEILSAQEVFAAIRENIRDKVLDVLRWSRGEFLVADYREPPAALPGSGLAVAGVLWQGVQQTLSAEQLRRQLEPLGALVVEDRGEQDVIDDEPCLRGGDLRLLRTLRRAAGSPLSTVLEELADENAIRVLYYLLLRGHLTLRGGTVCRDASARDTDTAARLRDARRRLRTLSRKNYYQVLEVPLSADDSTVREAYRNKAKDVHPDTLSRHDPAQLSRLCAETFQCLREAYDGLKTASKRDQYLHYLEGGDRSDPVAEGGSAMQAEVHYQEAQRFIRKRDWDAAAELLLKAVELTPQEGEYVLGLGIVRLRQAAGGRPELEREAEELFLRAKTLRPQSADPCYHLGRVALLHDDPDSAARHFQSALARNPNHVESQRELRLLRMRGGSRKRGLSGLFSRE